MSYPSRPAPGVASGDQPKTCGMVSCLKGLGLAKRWLQRLTAFGTDQWWMWPGRSFFQDSSWDFWPSQPISLNTWSWYVLMPRNRLKSHDCHVFFPVLFKVMVLSETPSRQKGHFVGSDPNCPCWEAKPGGDLVSCWFFLVYRILFDIWYMILMFHILAVSILPVVSSCLIVFILVLV